MHCDVAVVGAGAAGIAAAVAAATAGADVVLLERQAYTGGLATTAMVGTMCGLFYRHLTQARYAVHGFARDFADAIQVKSQTKIVMFAEGLHFLPYRPTIFHQEAVRQLQQAGVHLILQGRVIDAQVKAAQISSLSVQGSDSVFNLFPTTVIDCSGHAQVSLLAGVDTIKQSHYQAGAFVFQVCGLPDIPADLLSLNLIRALQRGIQTGVLEPDCARLSIIPGTLEQGVALFKLGMPILYDGTETCRVEYEQTARTRSTAIVDYLSHHEPLLVNLCITVMANEVGIRTGERAQGLDVLDETHVMHCIKPEHGIAIGTWPIEYWGVERKPDLRYFAMNDGYWISAEMLVSRYIDNLFFAGRGLSATELAIGSARVIGTCLATGYAAGSLAAEYANIGTWQSAISKIQQQIFTEHS